MAYLFCNTAPDNGTWSNNTFTQLFTIPVGSGRVSIPLSAAGAAGLKNGAQVIIAINQSGGVGNQNITIGSVQLEADPSGAGKANPFEFRPLPVELAMSAVFRNELSGRKRAGIDIQRGWFGWRAKPWHVRASRHDDAIQRCKSAPRRH